VLAHQGLKLAPMLAACVAVRAIHSAAVPGQPAPGIGVDILTVAQIEQLLLQRDLRRGIRASPANLASEHHRHRHFAHRSVWGEPDYFAW
jgi:hypothetical protein